MSIVKKHKIKFAIFGLFYILYLVVNFYSPKGYQIIGIGGISNIGNVIKVDGVKERTKEEGNIYTVSLPSYNNPSLLIHFLTRFDRRVQISKINSAFTSDEESQYSSMLYDEAINSSIVAAYEAAEVDLDYTIEVRVGLVLNSGLNKGFPYPSTIKKVNNQTIANVAEFRELIATKNTEALCNEKLAVDIYVISTEVTESKELTGQWDSASSSCKYGIILQNHINIDENSAAIKYTVDRPKNVGGNSGGLMQTLKIYNELMGLKNGSDLIKGRTITGTGTIDLEGNVGAIGGAYQKMFSVNYYKADIFFILDDEGDDLTSNNYIDAKRAYDEIVERNYLHEGLQLVKVKTLQDAIEYLKGTGN